MSEVLTASRTGVIGIDHVAITAADLDAACRFYADVLDAEIVSDWKQDGRSAVRRVRVGGAMVNVHQQGNGVELVSRLPTPGSADVCFRWAGNITEAIARLERAGVAVREGPVPRLSSDDQRGQSIYFTDPDGNLIELLTTSAD